MRRAAVSLKWKTIALLGMALMLVNAGMLVEQQRASLSEFAARQDVELQRKSQVLQRLLARSNERLRRIGSIVPSVIDALTSEDDLQSRWTTLQLELDLKALVLLDRQGQELLRGLPSYGQGLPEEINRRIAQALASEMPDQFLYCDDGCAQYALIPSIAAGGEQRLMVVAAGLTDLVLEFPGLTSAELAILAPGPDGLGWRDQHLYAVSNAPQNEPYLRQLSQQYTLAQLSEGRNLILDGRSYHFVTWPWKAFGGIGDGHLLLFQDNTDTLQQIAAQTRRSLLSGLLAMAIAILLGSLILGRPMNQLRRLADALPLLAEKSYARARQLVGTDFHRRRLPTEIDVLEGLTVDLADRLEELERQVENRNLAIAEKVAELRRSQELNEKILSTAPILILMLTGAGRIVQVNDFACALLGYGQVEFEQLSFLDLLADARQSREAGNVLVDLIAGRRSVFEQSGPVRCVDDGRERITWLHTRVVAQGGVFVLSLGLPEKSTETAAAA